MDILAPPIKKEKVETVSAGTQTEISGNIVPADNPNNNNKPEEMLTALMAAIAAANVPKGRNSQQSSEQVS